MMGVVDVVADKFPAPKLVVRTVASRGSEGLPSVYQAHLGSVLTAPRIANSGYSKLSNCTGWQKKWRKNEETMDGSSSSGAHLQRATTPHSPTPSPHPTTS